MQARDSLLAAIRPLTVFCNFFYLLTFSVSHGKIVVSKFKAVTSFCVMIACSAVKCIKAYNTNAHKEKYEQMMVNLTSYLFVVYCVASHLNLQVQARPITEIWNRLLTIKDFTPQKSFYRRTFIVCCLQVGISNLFFFSYLALYYYFYPEDFQQLMFVLETCADYFMILHFCAVSVLFSNGLLFGWKVIATANEELERLKKIEHCKNNHRWSELPFVKMGKITELRSQMRMIRHEDLSALVEMYDGVCSAAKELNDLFGVSVTSSCLKNQMGMTLSCYFMAKHGFIAVSMISIWVVYLLLMELTVIYACDKYVEETKRTGDILSLLVTENSSQTLKDAVQKFSQYLLHRQMKFTACRLFDLNYQFLFSVFSSIITYLAIVLQFDQPLSTPEANNSSRN